jgi:hypothetical protein
MDDKHYQTKYISLLFFSNGQIRINSDGWVQCREYSQTEANELLRQLSNQGWTLVGSFAQKHSQGVVEAMDLYFRRVLETPVGED